MVVDAVVGLLTDAQINGSRGNSSGRIGSGEGCSGDWAVRLPTSFLTTSHDSFEGLIPTLRITLISVLEPSLLKGDVDNMFHALCDVVELSTYNQKSCA
jgi:hypothetical protein